MIKVTVSEKNGKNINFLPLKNFFADVELKEIFYPSFVTVYLTSTQIFLLYAKFAKVTIFFCLIQGVKISRKTRNVNLVMYNITENKLCLAVVKSNY